MLTVDLERLIPGSIPRTGGGAGRCRVLDVGCGSGRHACAAARRVGTTVVGADIGHAEVKAARNRFDLDMAMGEAGSPIRLLAADITALPFPAAAFDLVICSEVLEHIPDHRTAAAEMARVLKPTGTLAVSVPRFLPEWLCWRLSRDYRRSPGGHLRIYTKNALISLVRVAGFRPVGRSHGAHSLHVPYWWLKCLVGVDRRDSTLVNLYHRLLVWDMMAAPPLTRFLDRLFNPLLGKSLVVYFRKAAAPAAPDTPDRAGAA